MTVSGQSNTNETLPATRSVGWAVLQLFRREQRGDIVLNSGFRRLPLNMPPMPDLSVVLSAPSASRYEKSEVNLFFRVGYGDMQAQLDEMIMDPDTHSGTLWVGSCK